MALYHSKLRGGIPSIISLPTGRFAVCYSNHSRRAAQCDRIPEYSLPDCIDMRLAHLVEVETKGNPYKAHKILVRVPYNQVKDLCLAIIVDEGQPFVKTVWLNDVSDTHKTLDSSKYDN